MARHVPLVPANNPAPNAAAKALALDADGAWFGLHPDRCLHIRPSIPYELKGWGPLSHIDMNWILVRVERGRARHKFLAYERVGIVYPGDIPDEEAVLDRVWRQFKNIPSESKGTYFLTPEQTKSVFAGTHGGKH